jgi:acyl dehydratase
VSFTDQHLFLDDIEIGKTWESLARTVTETDIVNFAGVSGDFNPIHMDHAYAATTPFRKPIAHGLLVFSISSGLLLHSPPVRTVAFMEVRDWKFKAPVFIGDTIRVRSTAVEKEVRAHGRRAVVVWSRQIINQDGKVVQEGETLTLVQGRASARGDEGET